jgi:hypothetical protein
LPVLAPDTKSESMVEEKTEDKKPQDKKEEAK